MAGYQNLPEAQDVAHDAVLEVREVVNRQLVLPVGVTMVVPPEHQWVIQSMTVLPHPNYSPPGTPRDQYAFGDVQLHVGSHSQIRANALTLMDRYWGRYNLDPTLGEVVAKLDEAQHAVQAAPTIPELAMAIERAGDAANHYQDTVSPHFDKPALANAGDQITTEQVQCEAGGTVKHKALDVELLFVISRPVLGRKPEATP